MSYTLHHCVDARSFRTLWMLEELGLRYELLPSPEAVQRYNTLKGSKALILHLTC